MKTISLLMLTSFAALACQAEIINGYRTALIQAERSLGNLTQLLEETTASQSGDESYRLKSHRLRAKRIFNYNKAYFLKTQELIESLKVKHPLYFFELSNIRNRHGEITDVYIRLMPEDKMGHNVYGSTNLDQADGDPHVYQSSFGLNTVSVQIRECSPVKQLRLLVHELGHVKYQVPNLASYVKYYEKTYQGHRKTVLLGHYKEDPSNKSVIREITVYQAVVYKRGKSREDLNLVADSDQ